MLNTHIIYIPGLGDSYDTVRRPLVKLWNRPGVKAELIPSLWSNETEDLDEKLLRIKRAIDGAGDARVVLVGESAGGALSLVAFDRFCGDVDAVITLCGMNQGAGNVSPRLYKKNRAFHDAMLGADKMVSSLKADTKQHITTIYSPADMTVRPKDTLLPGSRVMKLGSLGHFGTIMYVLAFRGALMRRLAS